MDVARFFKCLSDETRLNATLLIRAHGELCVCELVHALEDSQPKISRHLAQLRNCGLLKDARRGQWVYYSVQPDLPAWAEQVLENAAAGHRASLRIQNQKLKSMNNRPACC